MAGLFAVGLGLGRIDQREIELFASLFHRDDAGFVLRYVGNVTALSSLSQQAQRLQRCALSLPCLLYTSPSPRDRLVSRMPSSA